MKETKAKSPYWLGALAAVTAVCCGFYYWRFDAQPVSRRALERLTPGMTQAEVVRILGRPSLGTTVRERAEWLYTKPLMVNLVNVRFVDGELTEVRNGHR